MKNYYMAMNDYKESLKFLDGLLEDKKYNEVIAKADFMLKDTTDRAMIALLLYEKGKAYYHLEKHSEARNALTQALAVIDDLPNDEYKGEMLFHIASVYQVMGNVNNSQNIYERVLALLPPYHHYHLAAVHNLGDMYKRQNEYIKAKEYFEECYNKSVEHKNNFMAAYSSENLAELEALKGDKEACIKWLESALRYSREAGDDRLVALVNMVISMLQDAEFNDVVNIGNSIRELGAHRAHDVADAFFTFSTLLPHELEKRYINEAVMIYSEIGDGYMEQKAIEKLQALKN